MYCRKLKLNIYHNSTIMQKRIKKKGIVALLTKIKQITRQTIHFKKRIFSRRKQNTGKDIV